MIIIDNEQDIGAMWTPLYILRINFGRLCDIFVYLLAFSVIVSLNEFCAPITLNREHHIFDK